MNWIEGMKAAIAYMEAHLTDEVDYEKAAQLTGYSVYHFQRLFMMMAGVTVAEYVRNRRLSMSAVDLQRGQQKVIDMALKYGYNSPTSFNRAFQGLHGISPKEAKKMGVGITAFPPLLFEVSVKGSEGLPYKIVEKPAFRIIGKQLATTVEKGQSYQQIPAMWKESQTNGTIMALLALMNQEPYGVLGISDYNPDMSTSQFDYYIGVSSEQELPTGLAELTIPAGRWAVFTCQSAEEVAPLQQRIILEWLPSFGYEFAKLPDVEVYNADQTAEVWLPIIKR